MICGGPQTHSWRPFMSVNSDNENSVLICKTQVCTWLGLPKRTLERLVKQGDFPRPKQFGLTKKSYWLRKDVEAFIQQLEEQNAPNQVTPRQLTAARIRRNLAEKKEKVRGTSGSASA